MFNRSQVAALGCFVMMCAACSHHNGSVSSPGTGVRSPAYDAKGNCSSAVLADITKIRSEMSTPQAVPGAEQPELKCKPSGECVPVSSTAASDCANFKKTYGKFGCFIDSEGTAYYSSDEIAGECADYAKN